MKAKSWNWNGTYVRKKLIGERKSVPSGMLEVMHRCREMEDRDEEINRRLLILCRLAKGGCKKAAEILERHGIRQYTQTEIERANQYMREGLPLTLALSHGGRGEQGGIYQCRS